MKSIYIAMIALIILGKSSIVMGQMENRQEARIAFEYLNEFRENPKVEGEGIDLNLSNVSARENLVWNETLAKVALKRAMDMAKNNYFSHQDKKGVGVNRKLQKAGYKVDKLFLSNKASNSFESISAGTIGGKEAIISLIIDEGIPSLGHRKHLLGIDSKGNSYPKNSTLVDCGIAFVDSPEDDSKYISYMVVIIAKHEM